MSSYQLTVQKKGYQLTASSLRTYVTIEELIPRTKTVKHIFRPKKKHSTCTPYDASPRCTRPYGYYAKRLEIVLRYVLRTLAVRIVEVTVSLVNLILRTMTGGMPVIASTCRSRRPMKTS